jgi:hypothetical protein
VDGARGTGEIEDPVDFEEDRLRHVVPHKFEGRVAKEMRDVLLPAREEIVQTDYLVPVTDESLAKVGTDEPGTPGDENALLLRIRMVGIHINTPSPDVSAFLIICEEDGGVTLYPPRVVRGLERAWFVSGPAPFSLLLPFTQRLPRRRKTGVYYAGAALIR